MKKLLLAFAALALSACSITTRTPMTRFESPEAQGETLRGEVVSGLQARNEIQITPDYTRQGPSLDNASVEDPAYRLYAHGAVGLGERVDVSFSGLTSRFGAKVQVLGDPRTTAAPGNFPVAVYGGVSWSKENETNTGTYANNMVTNYRSYELKELQYDIGLLFGYRIAKQLLIYGGPFVVWDKINASYYGVNGAGSVRGTARVYNFNFGWQTNFTPDWTMRFEVAGSLSDIRRTKSGRGGLGVVSGISF